MKPYEIIATPLSVYLAPVGEPFPEVDEAPAGNWAQIGAGGNLNYAEEGVTVAHGQEITEWKGLGSTAPRKAFRTAESLMISLMLADVSAEAYQVALNQNAITTTAAGSGVPGSKQINMYLGPTVDTRALLIRGLSAYNEAYAAQWEVPVVYESASPETVFVKDAPAMLALEFKALEDPDATSAAARFGSIRHQTAVAT